MKLWPWQYPGNLSWFAIGGAYELAYAAPARERQAGTSGLRGYVAYLFAAKVRGMTVEAEQ